MAITTYSLALLALVLCSSKSLAIDSEKHDNEDRSVYCKDLTKIYPLCSTFTGFLFCQRTCKDPDLRQPSCGERFSPVNYIFKRLRRRSKRIVGGVTSNEGAWPWQVALLLRGKQYCAGAVLTPDWVVTAAHCFGDYSSTKAADWEVVLGEHHLVDREDFEQRRGIKNFIIHTKNYRFWKDGLMVPDIYDIALIKLDKPVTFTKWVQPICLPSDTWDFKPLHNCKVAGWGHTSYKGKQPDVLREATVMLIPRQICNLPLSYNGSIHHSSICAGFEDGGVDACQYDSGGALSCPNQNKWYLQGLVSWGFKCALPRKYGVYTNIPFLKQWILNTIIKYDPKTNDFPGRFDALLRKADMKNRMKMFLDASIPQLRETEQPE